MQEVLETLEHLGVVPVVEIERADDAVPLGRALIAGGLPCAEITFRTAAAEEAIRRIASELPEIVLGAGTVLSVEQTEKAVDAGARYIGGNFGAPGETRTLSLRFRRPLLCPIEVQAHPFAVH